MSADNITASRAYELAAAIEEVSNDVALDEQSRTAGILTLIGHAAHALVEYFDADENLWNGAEKHVDA